MLVGMLSLTKDIFLLYLFVCSCLHFMPPSSHCVLVTFLDMGFLFLVMRQYNSCRQLGPETVVLVENSHSRPRLQTDAGCDSVVPIVEDN
jgi:hypothetical protein